MPRPARYRVTQTAIGECTLWLADGYEHGRGYDNTDSESTHIFICGSKINDHTKQRYVFELIPGEHCEFRRQICQTLFGTGPTLTCTVDDLITVMRTLARQHCDAIDRENTRP